MEQRRKDIEALTQTRGYNDEEAEVVYHLKVAHDRLAELYERRVAEEHPGPRPRERAGISRLALIDPHFHALYAVLEGWVLERDYPARTRPLHSGADE